MGLTNWLKRYLSEEVAALEVRISQLEAAFYALKQNYDEKCVIVDQLDQAVQLNTRMRQEFVKRRQNRGTLHQRMRGWEAIDAQIARATASQPKVEEKS